MHSMRNRAARERPRICFPLCGDEIGGSHLSVLGLLKRLDRNRFDPVVLVESAEGRIANLMRSADVRVEVAAAGAALRHGRSVGLQELARIGRCSGALARQLARQGIDLVHLNDGRSCATWSLATKMSGAKLVWHHRGSPNSRGLRLVAPHLADAVVSVSRFALGPAERKLRRARVVYSPISAQLSLNRTEARARLVAELGCPPETFIVGFFGVLIPRKRPFAFIDAVAAMQRIEPGTPVVGALFGEPLEIDESALAEHARARGAESAIRLMGFRYPGIDWIAGCDLLMVPAVDEPLGRTLAEAMLVGTSIVATRSGGNAEALEEGRFGTLVEPDDAEAMARAALSLRADSERRNAAVHAAAIAAHRRFGEQHHATAIMDLYEDVLSTRSRERRWR